MAKFITLDNLNKFKEKYDEELQVSLDDKLSVSGGTVAGVINLTAQSGALSMAEGSSITDESGNPIFLNSPSTMGFGYKTKEIVLKGSTERPTYKAPDDIKVSLALTSDITGEVDSINTHINIQPSDWLEDTDMIIYEGEVDTILDQQTPLYFANYSKFLDSSEYPYNKIEIVMNGTIHSGLKETNNANSRVIYFLSETSTESFALIFFRDKISYWNRTGIQYVLNNISFSTIESDNYNYCAIISVPDFSNKFLTKINLDEDSRFAARQCGMWDFAYIVNTNQIKIIAGSSPTEEIKIHLTGIKTNLTFVTAEITGIQEVSEDELSDDLKQKLMPDTEMNNDSENTVQNKVIKEYVDNAVSAASSGSSSSEKLYLHSIDARIIGNAECYIKFSIITNNSDSLNGSNLASTLYELYPSYATIPATGGMITLDSEGYHYDEPPLIVNSISINTFYPKIGLICSGLRNANAIFVESLTFGDVYDYVREI